MENDTIANVELVSSETTGYLGADGQFVYGEPPVNPGKEIFVQTGEDIAG
jgi:hypothetical protein